MCEFRLWLRCQWDLRSSGILLNLKWQFFAEVMGQPVVATFKCTEHIFHDDILFKQIHECCEDVDSNHLATTARLIVTCP
jgi:hypothetical protein